MDNNFFLAILFQFVKKRVFSTALWTVTLCVLSLSVPAYSGSSPSLDYFSKYPLTSLSLPAVLVGHAPNITQLDVEPLPWKELWEEGRVLARQGDLAGAANSYKRFFTIKKVVEARWELACILAVLGEDDEAYVILEGLYEEHAERLDFVNGLAVMSMRTKHFERGAELFARFLQLDSKNSTAMAGAAYGFLRANKEKEALPFLELLWQQNSPGHELQEIIIETSCQSGDLQTARRFLDDWSSGKSGWEIIRCAATTYQLLGDSERAAHYWRQLLVKQPDNVEAHQRLADYYAKTGNVNKNLSHLLFLLKKNPKNPHFLKQIGQCYVGLKQFERALSYFERYIKKEPYDKGAVRFVVNIHAALGNKSETLRFLEHYFTIESHPAKEQLGKAAILYDEKGYSQQAIAIYRRMLDISPNDPDILVGLANNFMEIGSEEEALAVWKQLAEIVPDVVEVYRPMADLLERMGRRQEFIDVMAVIHDLAPEDLSVVVRLAAVYIEDGEVRRARALLNKFAGPLPLTAEFFYLRAMANYELKEFAVAVSDFEQVLTFEPDNSQLRFTCLLAYGRLGDQAMVRKHLVFLGGEKQMSQEKRLALATAFADSGLYVWARKEVQIIVDQFSVALNKEEADLVVQAVFLAAHTYELEELFYEAEQCLRKGLIIVGQPEAFCPKLLLLALKAGRFDEAQSWLEYLRRETGDSVIVQLLDAELLLARGKFSQFEKHAAELRYRLRGGGEDLKGTKNGEYFLELGAMLARYGQLREAAAVASQVLDVDGNSLEALVIVQKAHEDGVYFSAHSAVIAVRKLAAVQKIAVVRLFRKYEMYKAMEDAAREVLIELPGSFVGRLLLAEALTKQHKIPRAKVELLQLVESFPENEGLRARLAQNAFDMGELDKALADCQTVLLGEKRGDIILLSARILWMQNQWAASLEVYQDFLKPSVFAAIEARSELNNVKLPTEDEKTSWWELLGLSPDNQFPGQLVTGPEFMLSLLSKGWTEHDFNLAVVGDYAKQRWQEQFTAELQARNYVRKQEYYLAAKQLEYLLLNYPSPSTESLYFELAEVRGRLGKIGEEAADYEDLLARGISFPALPELIERNRLRRRPHVTLFSGYSKDEGRDDYVNMQKDWSGAALWFSPQTGHEAALELSRVNYHSIVSSDVMRSVKALASYQSNVLSGLTLAVKGGFESMDDSGVDNFLLKAEGVGTLGDKLSGSMSYERDLMYDTVASIRRDITRQTLAGSLLFEPLARLALGGSYFATDYSDNNWTTGYALRAGYVLLSEPTFLKISYSYEFKESEDGAMPGVPADDGFASGDHPYWSPKNYWINQFGVEFKHLLSADSMGKWTSNRYYTAEYYLGHDSDGYAVQTARGSMWYEINDEFNLKASGELVSSTPYRKKELLLSVDYRW